ncbi:MAG TPA: hypothetical protein VJI12_00480 [archaeon]|nr:hypothetical protein [archaeon]
MSKCSKCVPAGKGGASNPMAKYLPSPEGQAGISYALLPFSSKVYASDMSFGDAPVAGKRFRALGYTPDTPFGGAMKKDKYEMPQSDSISFILSDAAVANHALNLRRMLDKRGYAVDEDYDRRARR